MLKDYGEVTDVQRSKIKVVSNFHTHNYLCGHAGGTVSDYVARAVEYGYESIGISDHCLSPVDTYDPFFSLKNIGDAYLPQFDVAREKYGDKIKIYAGVEIEYFSGHDEYYRKLLEKLDYLVLGQHAFFNGGMLMNSFVDGDSESNVVAYCEAAKRGIESGFFSVFAHPDLIFYRRITPAATIKKNFDGLIK
ncbi:MAG: PHP domain-containing protein, partial [Clostridiales bacterium]|nr:PHP domain-containing protein [Clostridiales bacterium]